MLFVDPLTAALHISYWYFSNCLAAGVYDIEKGNNTKTLKIIKTLKIAKTLKIVTAAASQVVRRGTLRQIRRLPAKNAREDSSLQQHYGYTKNLPLGYDYENPQKLNLFAN